MRATRSLVVPGTQQTSNCLSAFSDGLICRKEMDRPGQPHTINKEYMLRGKILRDTNAGAGLLFVNGEQKAFTLETHWKSSTPPKVGGVVDVALLENGEVATVHAVEDTTLAKEQARKGLELALVHGKKWGGLIHARVGTHTLVAMGLVAVAWLMLTTVSVRISTSNSAGASFLDILRMINSNRELASLGSLKYLSSGIYGWLMAIALLAPALPHFLSNKHLRLAYCAPLAYMLAIAGLLFFSIRDSVSQARGAMSAFGGDARARAMADEMMSEMLAMTWQAISLGLGFYLAIATASYLAFVGIKKFLASTAT